MVKITNSSDDVANKLFPDLKHKLRLAQMDTTPGMFVKNVLILALIFTGSVFVISFIVLAKKELLIWILPLTLIMYLFFFILFLKLPELNIAKVRRDIEGDLFIPSRMFLTLIESGNSVVGALEGVSYTKAKSSKYFGKIASEIYLGKSITQAINDAIKYTPCDSFRRILEPIRKSLKTGTDIQKSLQATLEDLSKEKLIEIEKYEKKLGALSLFYMIFGTIIPAVGVVIITIIMSVAGIKVEFFPFLFIILIMIIILQLLFMRGFKNIRPLMRI